MAHSIQSQTKFSTTPLLIFVIFILQVVIHQVKFVLKFQIFIVTKSIDIS
jgi:hypothetical protein